MFKKKTSSHGSSTCSSLSLAPVSFSCPVPVADKRRSRSAGTSQARVEPQKGDGLGEASGWVSG